MNSTLAQAQASLSPYIRSRKEAAHIRQVLAAHVESQLNLAAGHRQTPVYSLVHDATTVKSNSGAIPGLRKDYLKALRANQKARREYDKVCNTNILRNWDPASRSVSSAESVADKSDQLEGYLALIKQRQRHERLRILQDYINKLEQKSAAVASYLDQSNPQLPGLPQIPANIAASSAAGTREPDRKALKDLTKSLEQAVLRAKLQLRNERQLLEHVRASSLKERDHPKSATKDVQTLQALGATRNELIAWVEEELGKAGESEPQHDPEAQPQICIDTNETIEDQLTTVKAQYGQYVQARRTFIDTIAETIEPVLSISPTEKKEVEPEDNEAESTPSMAWVVSPYLRKLQLISAQQKSSIQQKSHLTVSLAKQHKETIQLFDRLAHESHLLPAYPLKSAGRNMGHFDFDELAGKEMPSAAHRARAWTHAAESAGAATKDSVLALTEDGEASIEHARDMLATLEQLLGRQERPAAESVSEQDVWTSETSSSGRAKGMIQDDIWAALDGNLGVL